MVSPRSSIDRAFLVALAILIAIGVYQAWPESPRVEVQPLHTVDDALPEQEHILFYTIRNLTDQPIRVVGAGFT